MIYIYCLKDPRDLDRINYIGKTNKPVNRLAQHRYQWKKGSGKLSRINSWIKSLYISGLEPTMEIIDECDDSKWEQYEKGYIALIKSCGANLKNGTNGGNTHASQTKTEGAKKNRLETLKTSKLWEERNKRHSKIISNLHKEGRYKNFGVKNLPQEEKDRISRIQSETRKRNIELGLMSSFPPKPVIKVCLLTGKETNYESVRIAAKESGVNTRYIWQCLTKNHPNLGKKKGFIFKEAKTKVLQI